MTTMTRNAAAARLGVHWDVVGRLIRRGWLRVRAGRVAWADLRAAARDRRVWLAAPPERMADALLRAYALDARRQVGGGRWWGASDLCAHYAVETSTVERWRSRHGWPPGGAWERWGHAWFLWVVAPPAPPADLRLAQTPVAARRLQAAAAPARAAVVAAVRAAGGPPGRGGGRAFWPQIAAAVGCPPATAQDRWRRAVALGEVPGPAVAAD